MDLKEFLADKAMKPKMKTGALSDMILNSKISIGELIHFAKVSKDSVKATCLEAMEYATRQNPRIASEECLLFVTGSLAEKAPRVKWESAKVIGNIAHLFPAKLDKAISSLLANTEHNGTVVRWSAAFALTEIIKLNQPVNDDLVPAIKSICEREEKNSIKKIYLSVLKPKKK